MLIAIRADASLKIGTGHIFRMLTLAHKLTKSGHHIVFICRDLPGNLIAMVGSSFQVQTLPKTNFIGQDQSSSQTKHCAHANWLETSYQDEISDSKNSLFRCLKDREADKFDWIIVDHYAIEKRWHKEMRLLSSNIAQIDDLADRDFDCDILLDQNYYAEGSQRYIERVPLSCNLYVGPEFSLLRPEFSVSRAKLESYKLRRSKNNIVIFFGGIDAANETEKAIHGLLNIDGFADKMQVIIGVNNPHRERLDALCKLHHSKISLHVQVQNMVDYFASAYLYIGAVGATTWERCAMGLPGIVCSVAENQIKLAEELAQINGHFYLGLNSALSSKDYTKAYLNISSSFDKLNQQAIICSDLVDGEGADRVAEIITGYSSK